MVFAVPILVVYGIPAEQQNSPALRDLLLKTLPEAASSVPRMELKPGMVPVFAPSDMLDEDLGKEIIVTIMGLLNRPEKHSRLVLEQFAQAICDCVAGFALNHVPECEMVEVFDVRNPEHCFAGWERARRPRRSA